MSLQDTVFDLQFELEEYIQIAAGGGPRPTDDHKTMKKYHEIIERLWAYEERSDQLAKVEAVIGDFKSAVANIETLYKKTRKRAGYDQQINN